MRNPNVCILLSSRRILSRSHSIRFMSDERKRELYDRILRVDHAGELGADRIYAGQMAVLGRTKSGPLIQHMWDQEKVHLAKFEELIGRHRARPTVMLPFWNVMTYVLGAGCALLGEKAAMACTTAVEETIVKHYDSQIRELMNTGGVEEHGELLDCIRKFRDEELEHHDIGVANDAAQAPLHGALTQFIKFSCTGAIWISERI